MNQNLVLIILLLFSGVMLHAKNSKDVRVNEISKSIYLQAYKSTKHSPKSIYKVTDINIAKKLLAKMVKFGIPKEIIDLPNDPQKMIIKISTKAGKLITKANPDDPIWFVAYYPNENYLSVEGEYPADYGFDLKTGNLEMGSPEDTYISPNGKYIITGAYNGMECYGNHIMISKNGDYKTFYNFLNDVGCYFTDAFWQDNNNFFYSMKIEEENGIKWKYYHVNIK
ncbi:MAG: hypothetical protein NT103_00390 [Campylobacterales bacterium]|nr:hypothetical protein [Campylobacterales bacterium]